MLPAGSTDRETDDAARLLVEHQKPAATIAGEIDGLAPPVRDQGLVEPSLGLVEEQAGRLGGQHQPAAEGGRLDGDQRSDGGLLLARRRGKAQVAPCGEGGGGLGGRYHQLGAEPGVALRVLVRPAGDRAAGGVQHHGRALGAGHRHQPVRSGGHRRRPFRRPAHHTARQPALLPRVRSQSQAVDQRQPALCERRQGALLVAVSGGIHDGLQQLGGVRPVALVEQQGGQLEARRRRPDGARLEIDHLRQSAGGLGVAAQPQRRAGAPHRRLGAPGLLRKGGPRKEQDGVLEGHPRFVELRHIGGAVGSQPTQHGVAAGRLG
jgi:hypothetical protein